VNERADVALYIDPSSHHFLGDRLFQLHSGGFHSSLARCWVHLREVLTACGVPVHTADLMPEDVTGHHNVYVSSGILTNYRRLARRQDTTLSAFLVTESPIVEPKLYRGLETAQRFFKRIYSCSDDPDLERFVGAPLSCEPFRWPLDFADVDDDLWSRDDRKFLIMINMNKLPRVYWRELFTERVRAVEFFERYGEIDLYGVGWNDPPMRVGRTWVPWTIRSLLNGAQRRWDRIRPDPMLRAARRVYRGRLETKNDTLAGYRFALCFENTILKGWLTEKVFECFLVGTVPIYWGATDVHELIPPDCYIDMRHFSGYEDLRAFLKSLPPDSIRAYRENARDFIRSPGFRPFSKEAFVELFLRLLREDAGLQLEGVPNPEPTAGSEGRPSR